MKEKKVEFYKEKDVLGQEIDPVYIRTGELDEKKEKIDHSKIYELPSIKTRYTSMLLDALLILLLALGISSLFKLFGEVPGYVRGILFGIIIFLYEPLLVTYACTFGQLMMNIRVRNINNPVQKIKLINAFGRFFGKAILGWISLLTVTFNVNRRAIHDYISRSIVIVPKESASS
ncbi:RDD family protein [Bacteroidota bacterium]